MIKKLLILITGFILLMACSSSKKSVVSTGKPDWKNIRVLVYTKNGKGYVHDNIGSGTASIKQLGASSVSGSICLPSRGASH